MKSNLLTVEHLTALLLCALDRDGETLLTDVEAEHRAHAIIAGLRATRYDLKILPWKNVTQKGDLYGYPAYKIDDPRYDLNSIGPGEKSAFAINGPGISHGDLLRFGRACEIMMEFFPGGWPKETRDHILDCQSHLDSIEEILWIRRFKDVRLVMPNVLQPNGKDVDWAFESCSVPVQIEVKNFRKESPGIVDGYHRGRSKSTWQGPFKEKFFRDSKGSLNIACVTTHLEPDPAIFARAEELLACDVSIDALIIWSYNAPRGIDLTVVARPDVLDLVKGMLEPVPREDTEKFFLIPHLIRNVSEGRVATLDEILSQLSKIHSQACMG